MATLTRSLAVLLCVACGRQDSDAQGESSTGQGDEEGTRGGSSSEDSTTVDDTQPSTGGSGGSSSTGSELICEQLRSGAEETVASHVEQLGIVGLAVSVATDGCDPWAQAWGLADIGSRVMLESEMLQRIGSATKTLTSAVVLELVEDDLVSLDDSLADWGFAFPSSDGITVRQLLNHTSGIADYQTNDAFVTALGDDPARVWDPQELVDFAVELGQVSSPGSMHYYSNTNYILASLIVEQASGVSYASALDERVLSPLGLERMYVEDPVSGREPEAAGYLVIDGSEPMDVTHLYHPSQVWGAGAVIGTAGDLRASVAAIVGGDLLSGDSKSELLDFVPAGPIEYGLGVFQVEREGVVAIGHNGAVMGFQSAALVHVESGTSVAILQNQLTLTEAGELASDPTSLALDIIAAMLALKESN